MNSAKSGTSVKSGRTYVGGTKARTAGTTPVNVEVLVKDYETFLERQELADVSLLCGPSKTPILAHRAILAARCSHFRDLFKKLSLKSEAATIANAQECNVWGPAPTHGLNSSSAPIVIPKPNHIGDTPFTNSRSDTLEEIPLNQGDEPSDWGRAGADSGISPNSPDLSIATDQANTTDGNATNTGSSPSNRSQNDVFPSSASSRSHSRTNDLDQSTAALYESDLIRIAKVSPFAPLEVEFPKTNYESLAPLIRYLYTMSMEISTSNLVGVFFLAHRLGLKSVRKEILASMDSLITDHVIVDLLIAAHRTPHCDAMLEALFGWLKSDARRARILLASPSLVDLPQDLLLHMISLHLFPDEFEVYERFLETKGGETVEALLSKLSFDRMTPEQLLRVHNSGRVSDRVILNAFGSKVSEGLLSDSMVGGSSLLLEIVVFGEHHSLAQQHSALAKHGPVRFGASLSPRDPSPDASRTRYGMQASSSSRGPISGISPNTLIRRRSVSHAAEAEHLQPLGSDTWTSDTFKIHGGEWSIVIKTRGGLLYKVGLRLNLTAECDGVNLDSWTITLENLTQHTFSHQFIFPPTSFTMGKEIYQSVDLTTSEKLGFSTTLNPYRRPLRAVLQARVQFPVLSKISYIIE